MFPSIRLSGLARSAAGAFALALLCAAGPAGAAPAPHPWPLWQSLLDRYVIRIGDGHKAPFETRFDYEQLYVDENIWSKKHSDRLDAIHREFFSDVHPSTMDDRTRLAWAINAYNFLVVERATLLLLVPRHMFQRYESVAQMTSADGRFFQAKVAEVEGREYSLDAFERRFIYGDSTKTLVRRHPGDPRIMFALCRGSIGGPFLEPRAFRPESLEIQLDRTTREQLELPHTIRWEAATKQLLASNYLGERLEDFGGAAGVVKFAEKFGPSALRSALKRGKPASVSRFTPVDPKLNQYDRPKPPPPAGLKSGS